MIRFSSISLLVAMGCAEPAAAEMRTWTNVRGQTFEAQLVQWNGKEAIMKLANDRPFSTPIEELSEADRAFLRGGAPKPSSTLSFQTEEVISSTFHRPWPREVRLPGPVGCKVISEDAKKGIYIYESPNYRFTCDARITDDALRNFAVMFEATYQYAQNLPLSMGSGKKNKGRLDIILFGSMMNYIRSGGPPGSAGCYVAGHVLVPMASIGLIEGGTGFSLDTRRHNGVLVHELAHQLTPEAYFAPGARGWFTEGLAEKMAITTYNWGYYSIGTNGVLEKSYATGQGNSELGGRNLGTKISAPRLKDFMLMPYSQFSGANANFNYAFGLLITHYFCHMEGGGKVRRLSEFLKALQGGYTGEGALEPLLGGSTFEKLEADITAAWAKEGVEIRFGD